MNPSNPSPLTSGMRAVLRDPTVLVVEVVWRWCFGATTGALLFFGWLMAMGSVPVSRADANAWQSHDLYLMALAGLHVLLELGSKMARVAVVIVPALSLLWMTMGAAGRMLTMKRLAGRGRVIRFRPMLALHLWRVLLTLVVATVMAASVVGAALVAGRGPSPDYVMYYALALPLLAVAGIFWSIVNWYLSTAAAWVGKDGAGAIRAVRLAMGFSSAHKGDMAGLNIVFTLLRLMALAVAFVLCALPGALAAAAPRGYTAWIVAVSLIYFVIADFLHVSRLASYLRLDATGLRIPEATQEKIVIGAAEIEAHDREAAELAMHNGFAQNGHPSPDGE